MDAENKEADEIESAETKTDKKPSAPPCCVGCVRWEKFGKSCYYYWEGKKHCTMWISSWDEAVQPPLS